jgi:hypothetical protein
MTEKSEQILSTIDHLYWFKDVILDEDDKLDFLKTIKHLIDLVTND